MLASVTVSVISLASVDTLDPSKRMSSTEVTALIRFVDSVTFSVVSLSPDGVEVFIVSSVSVDISTLDSGVLDIT